MCLIGYITYHCSGSNDRKKNRQKKEAIKCTNQNKGHEEVKEIPEREKDYGPSPLKCDKKTKSDPSLVPRPVPAIRVTRGGLEPSTIANFPDKLDR